MQNLGTIFMNLVAIVGGAVIGAFVCGIIFRLMVRFSTKRYPPHVLLQAVRMLGGLACGLLVYLLVSSGGGGFGLGIGGLGLGGGQGKSTATATGTGTGKGTGTEVTSKDPATAKGSTETKNDKSDKTEPLAMLKVEMLGGKRYQSDSNRFYLIEDDKEPKTLTELVTIVQEKQKQPGFPGIEIVIYKTGSVANTHPAVKDLKDRAQGLGLAVKTTILDQDAPPLP
jgi:hypothetical protein